MQFACPEWCHTDVVGHSSDSSILLALLAKIDQRFGAKIGRMRSGPYRVKSTRRHTRSAKPNGLSLVRGCRQSQRRRRRTRACTGDGSDLKRRDKGVVTTDPPDDK